jgi:hypothetical protein
VDSVIFQGIKRFFTSSEEVKELVDPYVIFSFAGKKVNLKSKILSNQKNKN